VGVTSILDAAAGSGSTKCAQVLCSHGATVNAVPAGCDGTVLATAASAGKTPICALLLDAGADIELALRESLFTPLSLAANKGHIETVHLLVERGANVNVGDWKQRTPIMLACDNKHIEVVKALAPRADLMQRNAIGCVLLHHASACGTAFIDAVLPRYLEAGLIDVQTQDTGGRTIEGATTLIFLCCVAKYTEAKLLLQAGASRYVKDSKMRSAVHHAVVGNSLACLQLLLGEAPNMHYTPAQLNECDADGETPLHAAIRGAGNVAICRLLMAAGADPLVKTRDDGALDAAALARMCWPDRPELAAIFEPGAVIEPLQPPCCANCQMTVCKLSACAKCHIVRYCSSACGREHWGQHKGVCKRPDEATGLLLRTSLQ